MQSALDKLALDPPLLGVFVPRCKPDGDYEDQQCHELYCWCVDKDGEKIPGTEVQGTAVCSKRGKNTNYLNILLHTCAHQINLLENLIFLLVAFLKKSQLCQNKLVNFPRSSKKNLVFIASLLPWKVLVEVFEFILDDIFCSVHE